MVVVSFLSLSWMWNLWGKSHFCAADRTPGLPFLAVCGEAPEGGLEVLDSHPALLPLLHCWDLVSFPFWKGHTADVVLKRALDDKAFYSFFLPCVHMHSCSFFFFFVLWKHFVPLLIVLIKVFLTNSFLPELVEEEERKQTQGSCWLAWQQRSPSSSEFINFVAVWINLSAACCQLIIKKVKMSAR